MADNTEMMEQTIPEKDVEMNENNFDGGEEYDELSYWDSDEDEKTVDEEKATENAEENKEKNEEQENVEQTSETEEMFPHELVVYGEKKQVTMTEAKNLIQKGLAYDRAIEARENRLQTALNDPRLAFVNELAKAEGIDVVEYMNNVRNQKKYASLIESFGSLEDVPKDVLEMFTENTKVAEEKAKQEMETRKAAEEKEQLVEELRCFIEKHPEIDKIPEEVAQLKMEGHSLEGAYAIYENKQLKAEKETLEKELAVLKQNNKNRQTKMPSSQSKGNQVSEADAWWT